MTRYKTVEGFEIIVGECYQTRDGRKAFVAEFIESYVMFHGAIIEDSTHAWYPNGNSRYDSASDLMRPYPSKKIEVTDELVEVALRGYYNEYQTLDNGMRTAMEKALEAAFDIISAQVEQDLCGCTKCRWNHMEWSLHPTMEPENPVKICDGCKVNLYKDVCDCDLRETAQCSCKEPKYITKGSELPGGASYALCIGCGKSPNTSRIIQEPKEEKADCCKCLEPLHGWGGLKGRCAHCHDVLPMDSILEIIKRIHAVALLDMERIINRREKD